MKKQSYKINNNSSSADNQVRRETPPFVEFQTVRQFFRISLPDDIGMRDMEPINAKVSKVGDPHEDREFIGGNMKARSGRNKEKRSRESRGKSIGKDEERCTVNNSKDKRNSVRKDSDFMGLGKKKKYVQQLQNLLQRQVLYEKQDTEFTEKYVQRREKERDRNHKKSRSKSKHKQKQQQEQGTRKSKQKQTERSKEKGRGSKQKVAQTKKAKQKASQEWLQNRIKAHRENQQKSKTIQMKSNNIHININNWNNGSHNRSSGFNTNHKYEEFINLNFSQNLQPSRNQDIRKVYHIHSQRLKNNQSYNVNRREGKIGHRRGCSQHIWDGSKDARKGKSIEKASIINQKSHKIDNLINQICDNSFDQLSIYRLHTKQAGEPKKIMAAKSNNSNNKKQEKVSKLFNINVLQQLYNSSSSLRANKNKNKQHEMSSDSIDSQDQYLLTKISHDISKLDQGRKKTGHNSAQVNVDVHARVRQNRRSRELEVFEDAGEAVNWSQLRQVSDKIQMKNVKSQQILIPCPQIPNLHTQVPKNMEIEESLQKKGHTQNLLQKIDMVLQQIKCREKGQMPQTKQIAKIEDQQKQTLKLIQVENEQIATGNRNQIQQNGSNQYDSNNTQSVNNEFSNNISDVWDKQPTIMELELILDQCLDDKPNFQMQMGRVIGIGSQQNVNKPNQQALADSRVGKYSNLESKWKQSKQKTIKKAQKLLKQGIFLATKILKSRIPQVSNLPISRLSKKRQKYQSHSMQNLKSIRTISSIPHPSFSIPQKTGTEKSKIIQQFNEIIDDEDSFQVNSRSLIDQVYVKDVNQQKQGKEDGETRIWKVAEEENKKMEDLEKALATNKLKLNCDEIIQIVMLDLCIEIIEDVEIYFNKPGNIFQKLYLMLSKLKSKRRLGFSTSPTEIYSHLQKLSKFLQKTIDKSCEKSYIKLIQQRISEPIGPKPIQLLKFMREPTDFPFISAQDDEGDEDQKQEKQTFALSLSWFHEFSQAYIKQYDFGKYYLEDEERENKRVAFLKNAMHVHNKAIFDCVNELIDKHRPYGLIGQPFPWKPNLPPPKITPKFFSNILNSTFEQVSENTRFLCGIFAEQHLTYKLTKLQFLQFSQDRLNRMLCKHIEENQIRWTFVDDEETEVLVEVARGIIRQLVEEAVTDVLGCGA